VRKVIRLIKIIIFCGLLFPTFSSAEETGWGLCFLESIAASPRHGKDIQRAATGSPSDGKIIGYMGLTGDDIKTLLREGALNDVGSRFRIREEIRRSGDGDFDADGYPVAVVDLEEDSALTLAVADAKRISSGESGYVVGLKTIEAEDGSFHVVDIVYFAPNGEIESEAIREVFEALLFDANQEGERGLQSDEEGVDDEDGDDRDDDGSPVDNFEEY